METFPSTDPSPAQKKRRIPKACAACRNSKLRCDGGKPCTRCRNAKVWCDYIQPTPDPVQEKLAQIEAQMEALRSRVPDMPTAMALLDLQRRQEQVRDAAQSSPAYGQPFQAVASPVSMSESHTSNPRQLQYMDQGIPSPRLYESSTLKRKRGDFELNAGMEPDIISKGLISYDDAVLYFTTFFQGCDKYVPIFDPRYDTFNSVRERSSLLFDVICAVGCRAEQGPGSEQYQLLSNATKGPLCDVILGAVPKSIETVQALVVHASYSEKGWLLTSMAVRMALDLDLPTSYTKLSDLVLQGEDHDREDESRLMRETRVWFGTFVLEHILSIDCGKRPGIKAIDGMRRCRVLFNHPSRTALDLRLLAQVELNSIRALAHERLSPTMSDEEMNEIVQETRIDLSVWISDWSNLIVSNVPTEEERASLVVNLKIQREWSEMTMLCKGLQGMGINNVAIMSDSQRNLIQLAKSSAQRHLSTIISNPKLYLGTFRYGMDFVWAKCAFSVLLLLKLARLLPNSTNMSSLVSDAKILLSHLSKVRGSSNIYYRILCLSVEKCEKALGGNGASQSPEGENAMDAELDFQTYVPREFILEWNFPGLSFCWIPFDFQDLFLDLGNGFES
ncbi:uncharacterized protein LY89DRAFT_690509 [Mollisia scopiformis]|uniref:Zn(2)-C6 fungal-type domain-containing protein n=1 Tax=Mollisia scopiformis TaxID=149040 RepID=A0A132BBA1_MOLSC|nr:uncharacterized protein LY89DRAFT_690509 [Mollisia scopiformis]KUJ08937.1 hypothetical protein LY89DRAFT_690509 [Mollisia scopiformis]